MYLKEIFLHQVGKQTPVFTSWCLFKSVFLNSPHTVL